MTTMNITRRQWIEFVRFEFLNQIRRRSVWFLFLLFLFAVIGITSDALMDAQTGAIPFNAPVLLAEYGLIMGVVALLLMAAVSADAATRDLQTRMEPLMHAAPLRRAAYVGGRFFGAFLTVALLLAVVPLAQLIVPLFHPEVSSEHVGAPGAAAYLQTYLLLIVPNAFVGSAVLFALATLVRHTVGAYAGAALMFAGIQLSLDLVGEGMGRWDLAQLLDSTGLTTIIVISQSWPPAELAERLVGSEAALLGNRLLWFGIALVVLALTIRRFDFGTSVSRMPWWRGRRLPAQAAPGGAAGAGAGTGGEIAPSAPLVAPSVTKDFGIGGRLRQTLAVAGDSLREMKTPWTLLALPFFALKVLLNIEAVRSMGSGTMVFPTTGRVLEPLDDVAPPIVLAIVMFPVIVAGEMLWRERDANIQSLADSAPVPDGVRFFGKLVGLWFVIAAVHAMLALAAVLTQVSLGWYELEPALLFQIVFGLELVDALVFSLFALSIHILANQKHVGHVLVLLLIAASNIFPGQFAVEHPLLLLGFEPDWRHSAISGFEPFLTSVLTFELYWAASALLLALIARLFWVRGVEQRLRDRMRLAARRFTGRAARSITAAVVLVLLVGGFIFYNTNVLNEYETSAEIVERKAEYERRYGRHEGAAQPQVAATRLHVEIWPDRREAELRGVHQLVNRTPAPIDMIHVAIPSTVELGEIEFSRPARAALLDDQLGHRIYALNEPLQPGVSVRMSWSVRHAPRGFPAGGISSAVVENGSFFVVRDWMPLIGYQPSRELTDAAQRKELGLPEHAGLPSPDDHEARHDPLYVERTHVEVTIGTAADQVAVAVGELKRSWTQNGRRYFHYVPAVPIQNDYAIFSADYAVRRSRVGEVAIEIYHHPGHAMNVDRMIRSMEVSLAQFTERFGPYPFKVLRMVEYPGEGGSLHAAPATIWYKELFSLFDPGNEPRGIDLPFAVVAHEVAHQFQPVPARVEGIALLSESFAWYAAMGVIEQEHGTEHLQRFLSFMHEAYLRPRSRAGVPLLRASDWFLGYRKGPLAMYALREYVGQERVDLAWRRLRARHASFEPPFATSLDLYRELKQVTPDSLHYLLADLLERNTFWELKTTGASAHPTANGQWQVSLQVEAQKRVVDEKGEETEVAMNDLIEIGVFAPPNAGEDRGKPLYLTMHRISTGQQTITMTVPAAPARAGIDPRHLLIDATPRDNLVGVSSESPDVPRPSHAETDQKPPAGSRKQHMENGTT